MVHFGLVHSLAGFINNRGKIRATRDCPVDKRACNVLKIVSYIFLNITQPTVLRSTVDVL